MEQRRIKALLDRMQLCGADALLLHNKADMRYFTQYTGEGYAVISKEGIWILTDSRYSQQASIEAVGYGVLEVMRETPLLPLQVLVSNHGFQHIAYQSEHMAVSSYRAFARAIAVQWIEADGIDTLRQVKDDNELYLIGHAAQIAHQAYEKVLLSIKPGVSERDIACELEYQIGRFGGQGTSFNTIVASGVNGALPHATPGERRLQNGDMITIDMGAVYEGYCSDMTRTIALGQPAKQLEDIYHIVLDAQMAALDALHENAVAGDIDKIARDLITKAGYGEYFCHGLGHGVGLEIHELPRLAHQSEAVLAENMVVTVEPGIYVPGLGGVRIEDLCIVSKDGYRNVTPASKAWTCL